MGYELKLRNPEMRKNILFEDTASDLKMDVALNGTDWKTVLPADARRLLENCRPARGGRETMSQSDLDEILTTPRTEPMDESR